MTGRLEGKTALVAGAARGAGKTVAKALYGEGARVILCDRNARDLIAAAKEIGEIICVPAAPAREAKRLIRRLGRPDILVGGRGLRAAVRARRVFPMPRSGRAASWVRDMIRKASEEPE